MVSGGGTNLQALIDAEKAGKIPHGHIDLVISNREGAYALTRARNAGIETVVVRKTDRDGQAGFEDRIIEELEKRGTELIILAGFMSILSERFTEKYPERIIKALIFQEYDI